MFSENERGGYTISTYKEGEILIEVIFNDITNEKVDAIVEAANNGLYIGGGVSGSIGDAGGIEYRKNLEQFKIETNFSSLPTGMACITGAGGTLPCKYVIHSVGPICYDEVTQKAKNLLYSAFMESLLIADKNKLESISIPSISSGIFGFPKDLCAEIAMQVVKEYIKKKNETSTLKIVRFTNCDMVSCNLFKNALGKELLNKNEANEEIKNENEKNSQEDNFGKIYEKGINYSQINTQLEENINSAINQEKANDKGKEKINDDNAWISQNNQIDESEIKCNQAPLISLPNSNGSNIKNEDIIKEKNDLNNSEELKKNENKKAEIQDQEYINNDLSHNLIVSNKECNQSNEESKNIKQKNFDKSKCPNLNEELKKDMNEKLATSPDNSRIVIENVLENPLPIENKKINEACNPENLTQKEINLEKS